MEKPLETASHAGITMKDSSWTWEDSTNLGGWGFHPSESIWDVQQDVSVCVCICAHTRVQRVGTSVLLPPLDLPVATQPQPRGLETLYNFTTWGRASFFLTLRNCPFESLDQFSFYSCNQGKRVWNELAFSPRPIRGNSIISTLIFKVIPTRDENYNEIAHTTLKNLLALVHSLW